MKLLSLMLLFCALPVSAAVNPLKAPVWSDLEKYQSKTTQTVPFLEENYIAFGGLNYGFKNGLGFDGMACRKLSRYLCAGARVFLGSLNSAALVRAPTLLEDVPVTSEFETLLVTQENWFAFVPEVGLSVHTQIIPLAENLWSESAWFGIGKAYMGGLSGWVLSFEPGINKKFSASIDFGWSVRAKYTFGWLYSDGGVGTIPVDWFNLTAGIFYVW
jgi:hypothetical protein